MKYIRFRKEMEITYLKDIINFGANLAEKGKS